MTLVQIPSFYLAAGSSWNMREDDVEGLNYYSSLSLYPARYSPYFWLLYAFVIQMHKHLRLIICKLWNLLLLYSIVIENKIHSSINQEENIV